MRHEDGAYDALADVELCQHYRNIFCDTKGNEACFPPQTKLTPTRKTRRPWEGGRKELGFFKVCWIELSRFYSDKRWMSIANI